MNNGKVIIASAIVGILALSFCCWMWSKRQAENEFKNLFVKTGGSHFRMIEIFRSQGNLTIADRETLSVMEEAFRTTSTGAMQLGSTYEIRMKFDSSRVFETCIYVHNDYKGITVANPTENHAGDPEYIPVRFSETLYPKIRALMDSFEKAEREQANRRSGKQ